MKELAVDGEAVKDSFRTLPDLESGEAQLFGCLRGEYRSASRLRSQRGHYFDCAGFAGL
jgi:hypothetical protein